MTSLLTRIREARERGASDAEIRAINESYKFERQMMIDEFNRLSIQIKDKWLSPYEKALKRKRLKELKKELDL